jgi:hypothetical protein
MELLQPLRLEGSERLLANIENLKPFTSEQSREKAKENGRKGGIASGEAKRQKNTIKSILKQWADSPITVSKLKKEAKAYGIETDEGRSLITLALIKGAMKGNAKYMERLLDTLGEDALLENNTDDGFNEAIKGTASDDWKESGNV